MNKILKYTLALSVGILLLWQFFRNVDFFDIISRFVDVKYKWIFLSIFFALLSHICRAYRCSLMLRLTHGRVSTWHNFLSLMSGYFINLFIPRMGEVTRCVVLKRTDGVKISSSLSLVILERVIDVAILLGLILLAIIIEGERILNLLQEVVLSKVGSFKLLIPIILAFAGICIVLILISLLIKSRLKKNILYLKTRTFISEIVNAVKGIRKIESPALFVALSLFIWLFYLLLSYVPFFSTDATSDLDLRASLVVLIMGGLGMAAPVQGGIGAYHLLVSSALIIYGIETEDGKFFATLLHMSQFLFMLISGGLCFILSFLLKRKRLSEPAIE